MLMFRMWHWATPGVKALGALGEGDRIWRGSYLSPLAGAGNRSGGRHPSLPRSGATIWGDHMGRPQGSPLQRKCRPDNGNAVGATLVVAPELESAPGAPGLCAKHMATHSRMVIAAGKLPITWSVDGRPRSVADGPAKKRR